MRTIVVGVDGSTNAERALRWAAARSRESGAEVLAVFVLTSDHDFATHRSATGATSEREALLSDLNGEWTEPARRDGATVRTAVVEADIAAIGILSAAQDHEADLIVLGTHGRGHLANWLLGATTYKVSHRAAVPVVVVPPQWNPSHEREPQP